MTTNKINLVDLLEAGVHFGHTTARWHPKMAPFIYTQKNKIHIIDLRKTLEKLKEALDFIQQVVRNNGRVLFVGTKLQAADIIKDEAARCGMPYVSERWFGGTLTNFKTIQGRINRLSEIENLEVSGEINKYPKNEQLIIKKEKEKLLKAIGGIRNLNKLPEALFIIDVTKERVAVSEAKKLGIPIIALVDTNSNPEVVDYPIPANDDASKSIRVMVRLVAEAILEAGGQELSQEIKDNKDKDDQAKDLSLEVEDLEEELVKEVVKKEEESVIKKSRVQKE